MHIDDVIDKQMLPEPIFNKYAIIEKSFGMFSDGKLSSERFIKEKDTEKELER